MDWSTILTGAGAAASVGSGGIFGILGAGIGQVFKLYQRKQDRIDEQSKRDHAIALYKLNMQAKAQETEQELAIVSQAGAWAGLKESIDADARIPVTGKAATIKALFRPFITTALWCLAGWVFYEVVSGELRVWFVETEIKEIIKYMVYSVFFTASSATLWWFGDRAFTPPEFKNR